MCDFDHDDGLTFAKHRPLRTLTHVADALEEFGAEEAAEYTRAARDGLEAENEQLREAMADALFAFDQGRTHDAARKIRVALDGGGDDT